MPDEHEIVLRVSDVNSLFNTPVVNPLSNSPLELLGINGVDYLITLLMENPKRKRYRKLVILIPPEKAYSLNEMEIKIALRNILAIRIEQQRQELRNTYRYGWRITGIAVLILAVCLALASLFESDLTEWMRPLIRKTLEYGFEIIGWVMLWHPVDVLAFVPVSIRSRIRALRTLTALDLKIRTDS